MYSLDQLFSTENFNSFEYRRNIKLGLIFLYGVHGVESSLSVYYLYKLIPFKFLLIFSFVSRRLLCLNGMFGPLMLVQLNAPNHYG